MQYQRLKQHRQQQQALVLREKFSETYQIARYKVNPPTVTHPVVSGRAIGLGSPSIPAVALKHPRTPPTNPSVDYPSKDFDHPSKRTRPIGISDEVNLPVNVLPVSFTGHSHSHSQAFSAPEDLPKTVTRTLNQGSSPMTIDRSCILKAHCPNLFI
ncbi:hypothetical protein AB3S75_042372 [Citrus x aurantiifolia]